MSWGYDELDRITQAVTPQGTIGYSYDAAGRRTGMTPAAQAAVSYAYDNANRLSSITQGSEIVQFAYDNGNRRTQLTLPNGVTVAYGYDDGDQLTSLNYKQGNGTALGDLSYGYDIAGRVTGQGGSLAFNQLPEPTTQPSTFDANNRQTSFNGATLTYDANGNLTSDGTNTFEWNARDQLVKVMQGGTPKLSYRYDAMGRRTSKTVDTATPTQYLYDGDNAVQEQEGTAINPILAGLGIDERFARNDVTGRTYFLADMLGSTIGLADAAGQIKQQYRYDPYGNVSQSDTTTGFTNPYQYTGREADTAGLYYYRARYYSPGMGRFISEDPAGFTGGQLNLYAYVNQSPTNYVDPSGMFLTSVDAACMQSPDLCLEIFGTIARNQGAIQAKLGNVCGEQAWNAVAEISETAGKIVAVLPIVSRIGKGAVSKITSGLERDFFAGTRYSEKVAGQIKIGDMHAFPENVTAFQSAGQITMITGRDGIARRMLKIPGEYRGKQGFFEFIKEADGTINHRLFRPLSGQ